MKDKISYAISGANWITPAVTFIQDIIHGPTSHFAVPGVMSGGPDRRAIKRLLQERGMMVWGMIYSPDLEMLMFSVPRHQAVRVRNTLELENIPILYAPPEVVNSSTPLGRSRSTRQAKKEANGNTLLDQIFGLLDWLDIHS